MTCENDFAHRPAWQRHGDLPPGRPDYLEFIRPRRLVAIDQTAMTLRDLHGDVKTAIDWPGGNFVDAAVAHDRGLLAVSSTEALRLYSVTNSRIFRMFCRPADHGPVCFVLFEDKVLIVCCPSPTVVAVIDPEGKIVARKRLRHRVDALFLWGQGVWARAGGELWGVNLARV